MSYTNSKVRRGCGTEYKIVVSSEMLASICARPKWWSNIVQRINEIDKYGDKARWLTERASTTPSDSYLSTY
jgi:hypothetical protein